MACRIWGLRSTDIMQGAVYGTRIDEMEDDERLLTRFDFDQCFGTAINRFCCQAAIGEPRHIDVDLRQGVEEFEAQAVVDVSRAQDHARAVRRGPDGRPDRVLAVIGSLAFGRDDAGGLVDLLPHEIVG